MCADCQREQHFLPDARFTHALYLMSLQEAGMSFDKNDLDLEEWNWLAECKAAIEKYKVENAK